MLQSPRLEHEARQQAEYRCGMVSNVAKWVPNAEDSMLGWAETMVRSRALTFESGWKGTEMMCMVPFVDLANHRVPLPDEVPCFPVDLVRSIGDECVVLRAPRDLAAGNEVTITYGYDGNDHLLLDYGFAEAARPGQLGSESLWLDGGVCLEVVHAVPDDLGLIFAEVTAITMKPFAGGWAHKTTSLNTSLNTSLHSPLTRCGRWAHGSRRSS